MRYSLIAILVLAVFAPAGAEPVSSAFEISRQSLPCGVDVALGCQDDTEQETNLAINPADPDNAIAVVQQGRYMQGAAQGIAYTTTVDGGHTWEGGTVPGLTTGALPSANGSGAPWDRASDPVVAFDRKHGVVLVQSLVVDGVPSYGGGMDGESGVVVNRSTDGGRSFDTPIGIDVGPYVHDKNWIAVDNSPKSPFYGRAYAGWTRGFAASDDGGLTWQPNDNVFPFQPQILVGPLGRVTMINGSVVLISSDGGSTWHTGGTPPGSPGGERYLSLMRDFAVPASAIDPVSGDIVYAFQDASRRDVSVDDIAVSRSSDGGATWSSPAYLTAGDDDRIAHFLPAVAVEGNDVFVTYRRRDVGPATEVDIVMQVSHDRGQTFGPATTLAPPSLVALSPITYGQALTPSFFLGEYMGLAVRRGQWYAAWIQTGVFADGEPGRTHQRLYAATGAAG